MNRKHPVAVLVVFLVVGALMGSILNEVLSPVLPFLRASAGGGIDPPFKLTLPPISFSFGFTIHLTMGTAIGLILGLVAYKRF
ncbi:MAG: hypothetical protein NVSMB17_05700 [Candidatus Dormibacteria bacterium]